VPSGRAANVDPADGVVMSELAPWVLELGAYLRIGLEITILAVLIYGVLYFVRGTRAEAILVGLSIVIVCLGLLSRFLGLEVIDWLLANMYTFLAISVLVIFQSEIRRAFAEIGSTQSRLRFHPGTKRQKAIIATLLDATFFLADRRIGALIAIEQDIPMRAYAETGTPVDAPVTSKLLSTVFFPNTPLHDGGVIISRGSVAAAGCIFPLTQNPDMSQSLGTRHRAGVGITEETDCVTIIVSEESGAVSLAHKGRLIRGIDADRLRRHLTNYLVKKPMARTHTAIRRTLVELEPTLDAEQDVTLQP
jgi:diadenylate cyclase